jgi:hypothetical protein
MVDKLKTILSINGEMYDLDDLPEHTIFCTCNKKSCRTVSISTFHKNIKKMEAIKKDEELVEK